MRKNWPNCFYYSNLIFSL